MLKKEKFRLSPSQEDIFRNQVINQTTPGTILADFEKILEIIETTGIPISGIRQLIPMKHLPEINKQLSQPFIIKMKRPQQKSYPNINALYIILWATGLVKLSRTGKKQQLCLDKTCLALWQNLNSTERYFYLLEAWWCRGSAEVTGEPACGGIFSHLLRSLEFALKLPPKGRKIAGNKAAEDNLKYFPGLYCLAMLELFGFITIQHGSPAEGKGWCIKKITPTSWGNAVLPSIYEVIQLPSNYLLDKHMATESGFARWREQVQPCCQPWKNSLVPPKPPFQGGVHVFKVFLGKPWRRIAIQGKCTLDQLASKILAAFDFDSDHLYQFTYKDSYGQNKHVDHPFMQDENLCASDVRIGALPLVPGAAMTFLFDFGDCWTFGLLVEETEATITASRPTLLDSHGEAPEQYPEWEA